MTNVSLETYENLLNDYFEAYGAYDWEIQPVFPDLDFGRCIYFATYLIGSYHTDKDSLQFVWFENGRLYTEIPFEETVDLLLRMRDANFQDGELDETSYELEKSLKKFLIKKIKKHSMECFFIKKLSD